MRKQFTFYKSYWDTIQGLPTNKEKLQAFQLICGFAIEGIEPSLGPIKPAVAALFEITRPHLERAHERSQKILTANKLLSTTEKGGCK